MIESPTALSGYGSPVLRSLKILVGLFEVKLYKSLFVQIYTKAALSTASSLAIRSVSYFPSVLMIKQSVEKLYTFGMSTQKTDIWCVYVLWYRCTSSSGMLYCHVTTMGKKLQTKPWLATVGFSSILWWIFALFLLCPTQYTLWINTIYLNVYLRHFLIEAWTRNNPQIFKHM